MTESFQQVSCELGNLLRCELTQKEWCDQSLRVSEKYKVTRQNQDRSQIKDEALCLVELHMYKNPHDK